MKCFRARDHNADDPVAHCSHGFREVPNHKVADAVVLIVFRAGKLLAMAREIALKIGHSQMIDGRIRLVGPPKGGVEAEGLAHVRVNETGEINAQRLVALEDEFGRHSVGGDGRRDRRLEERGLVFGKNGLPLREAEGFGGQEVAGAAFDFERRNGARHIGGGGMHLLGPQEGDHGAEEPEAHREACQDYEPAQAEGSEPFPPCPSARGANVGDGGHVWVHNRRASWQCQLHQGS
jgi:hypothetical protein